MAITTKEITEKNTWEDFIKSRQEANFLHSWQWGEFQNVIGHDISRIGFYKSGQLVGIMLFIVEDARRGRYGVVPAGPILDWTDESLAEVAFKEMKKIAKQKKCVFVRVRPQLLSDHKASSYFSTYGFKPAPMHLHAELTWQLDLTQSEEDILAKMRKKTRYEIKQAEKIKIEVSTTNDPESINRFYDIQLQTARRHGFVPFSKKFLKEQFRIFSESDNAVLFEARHDNKLLAQAFIIFYGNEAAYHYGTSTDDGRDLPGAYAIQWEAIKEAKKRGIKRYNFWGVTKPDQIKHRFYGVSIFKRGFGGEEVEYLHAQDLVISKPKYLLNATVEYVRKHLRNV